jgi:hypothetical protein
MSREPGLLGSTHRRGTYMVGAYRCGPQEAETNGFRDQKIQAHTRRQATLVTLPCRHCVSRLLS